MAKKEKKTTTDRDVLEWVFANSRDRKVRNEVGSYLGYDILKSAENNSFEAQGIEVPDSFRVGVSPTNPESSTAETESRVGGDASSSDDAPGNDSPSDEGVSVSSGEDVEV